MTVEDFYQVGREKKIFVCNVLCNFLLYDGNGRALICTLYKTVSSMSRVYCWSMGVVDSPEGYSVILDIGTYFFYRKIWNDRAEQTMSEGCTYKI